MVTSEDGKAQLALARTSLPPGVTVSDVKLTEPAAEESAVKPLDEGGITAAYKLEPEALEFTAPVPISITVPLAKGKLPVVWTVSDGRMEPAMFQSVVLDEAAGSATVTAGLSRSGKVLVKEQLFYQTSISVHGDQAVGKPFDVSLVVLAAENDALAARRQQSAEPAFAKLGGWIDGLTADGSTVVMSIDGAGPVQWSGELWAANGRLSPAGGSGVPDATQVEPSRPATASMTFTPTEVGTEWLIYYAHLTLSVEVTGAGADPFSKRATWAETIQMKSQPFTIKP